MRNKIFSVAILLFIAGYFYSCAPKSKKETKSESKVELCQGDYYTEAEAVEKLAEYAKLYSNADEWNERAEKIRAQIRKGSGLDKISESDWKYPIKVTRGAKHEMDGYTVENIALELKNDYLVHGNLYIPDVLKGKVPIILNPHGHWFKPEDYGRFRADMQYRCIAFAKMGAIAFNWDMYGMGEDTSHVHLSKESFKMQTFNTLRIIDYFLSLPIVDPERIAITGASGGGTQTFVASAIDSRIDVSVPVVQVSAHFFGGCECESGVPVHKCGDFETNNVEFAACFAPKPLMLISDGDDWTKNVYKVEYPYIKNIYTLFDAADNVENAHFVNEVHNYGPSKRKAAYKFLAKHLNLNIANIYDANGNIDDTDVQLLKVKQLMVFPDKKLSEDPWGDE